MDARTAWLMEALTAPPDSDLEKHNLDWVDGDGRSRSLFGRMERITLTFSGDMITPHYEFVGVPDLPAGLWRD